MSEIRIASRYAKALFDCSLETDSIGLCVSDIQQIQEALMESQELRLFINTPLLRKVTKKEALSKIFASCSALTCKLLMLMTDKNRESYIPSMTDAFMLLYYKHKGITTAIVSSALALSDANLQAIKTYIVEAAGASDVLITQTIDPTLIGGMNIMFDGKIYDATLSNQLNKLKKDLQIA